MRGDWDANNWTRLRWFTVSLSVTFIPRRFESRCSPCGDFKFFGWSFRVHRDDWDRWFRPTENNHEGHISSSTPRLQPLGKSRVSSNRPHCLDIVLCFKAPLSFSPLLLSGTAWSTFSLKQVMFRAWQIIIICFFSRTKLHIGLEVKLILDYSELVSFIGFT